MQTWKVQLLFDSHWCLVFALRQSFKNLWTEKEKHCLSYAVCLMEAFTLISLRLNWQGHRAEVNMTISHLFKPLSSIMFIVNPIGRLRDFCSKVYNLQLEHKLYFKTRLVVLFVFYKYTHWITSYVNLLYYCHMLCSLARCLLLI